MWACKNYDGDVQSDILARVRSPRGWGVDCQFSLAGREVGWEVEALVCTSFWEKLLQWSSRTGGCLLIAGSAVDTCTRASLVSGEEGPSVMFGLGYC